MKKFNRLLIIMLAGVGVQLQSGCYGSFKLVEKVYEWNGSIEDKFVRSIVFWALCIIPVYPFAGFVDAVILNVIEFWSGSNPVSMKEGEHEQQVVQYLGKTYLLEATKNRFKVSEIGRNKSKKPVELVFRNSDYSWNLLQDKQLITISRLEKGTCGEVSLRVFSKEGKSTLLPYAEQIGWMAFTRNLQSVPELTANR